MGEEKKKEEELNIPTPEELEKKESKEPEKQEEEEVVAKPDYEEQAKVKGWRPEEEYEGDTPWVDAKEFMGRQPLFDAIHKLNKKSKDQAATIDNLVDHNRTLKETTRKEVLAELKAQKVEALENDDHKAVVEIDDKIDDVKREAVEEKAAPKLSEAYTDFVAENAWYENDSALKKTATDMGYGYQFANPGATETEIFEFVSKQIKIQHPEKFEPKKNPKREQANDVAPPKGGNKTPPKKATLKESDLTYDRRQVMNNIVRNSLY